VLLRKSFVIQIFNEKINRQNILALSDGESKLHDKNESCKSANFIYPQNKLFRVFFFAKRILFYT
jgi:hypothetical protein